MFLEPIPWIALLDDLLGNTREEVGIRIDAYADVTTDECGYLWKLVSKDAMDLLQNAGKDIDYIEPKN